MHLANQYGSFYELIQTINRKRDLYPKLLEKYSKEEIEYFGKVDSTRTRLIIYLS